MAEKGKSKTHIETEKAML